LADLACMLLVLILSTAPCPIPVLAILPWS
jgi:hypothetical protein